MFSGRVNDTSKLVRMTIVGDATTLSITSGNFWDVIYNRNIFIIEARGQARLYIQE